MDGISLGLRLAGRFGHWKATGGPYLPEQADLLMQRIHLYHGFPLGRACAGAAKAVARWGGHPYHSAVHHAEVANCAVELALARPGGYLGERDLALLLCAALGHDLDYVPVARHEPFKQEAVAAERLDIIAAEAGVGDDDRSYIRALVLATEPTMRMTVRAIADGREVPVPPELHLLAGDRTLAHVAAVLSDADITPSAGLCPEWSLVQEERLRQETGKDPGPAGYLGFLDGLVGRHFSSEEGRLMDGNLEAIREWAQARMGAAPGVPALAV